MVITATVNIDGAARKLDRLSALARNATPLMREFGAIAQEEVRTNINVGGRPPFVPNAPSTVRQKRHARPLIGKGGEPSGLSQLLLTVRPQSVEARTTLAVRDYARIHNQGGRAGRNRAVRIPKREYARITRTGRERLKTATREHFQRHATV